MNVAEATIQYVNPPKEGKKWGSIKTSEGDYYSGPMSVIGQAKPGDVRKFNWEPFGDGTGKKIVSWLQVAQATPKQINRPSTSPSDSRQIFITACLKEFIGVGKVDLTVTDLVQALKTLGESYDRWHNPQRADDLNDEIPY